MTRNIILKQEMLFVEIFQKLDAYKRELKMVEVDRDQNPKQEVEHCEIKFRILSYEKDMTEIYKRTRDTLSTTVELSDEEDALITQQYADISMSWFKFVAEIEKRLTRLQFEFLPVEYHAEDVIFQEIEAGLTIDVFVRRPGRVGLIILGYIANREDSYFTPLYTVYENYFHGSVKEVMQGIRDNINQCMQEYCKQQISSAGFRAAIKQIGTNSSL